MDNTSSPDLRLVELTCYNRHTGTPILNAGSVGTIGAYCGTCRIWIKWVPNTVVWKSLLTYQQSVQPRLLADLKKYADEASETPAPPSPPTVPARHDFARVMYTEGCYCGAPRDDPVHDDENGVHIVSEERKALRSNGVSLPELGETTQSYFRQAISSVARFCNDQAIAMGFLDKERSLGDMLTLINTEMSELFEAHRHGTSDDPSEHIPDYTQKEEEWADIGVRWFCHAIEDGVSPIRLGEAFVAKLQFNRTRGYRHGGKRV